MLPASICTLRAYPQASYSPQFRQEKVKWWAKKDYICRRERMKNQTDDSLETKQTRTLIWNSHIFPSCVLNLKEEEAFDNCQIDIPTRLCLSIHWCRNTALQHWKAVTLWRRYGTQTSMVAGEAWNEDLEKRGLCVRAKLVDITYQATDNCAKVLCRKALYLLATETVMKLLLTLAIRSSS